MIPEYVTVIPNRGTKAAAGDPCPSEATTSSELFEDFPLNSAIQPHSDSGQRLQEGPTG